MPRCTGSLGSGDYALVIGCHIQRRRKQHIGQNRSAKSKYYPEMGVKHSEIDGYRWTQDVLKAQEIQYQHESLQMAGLDFCTVIFQILSLPCPC